MSTVAEADDPYAAMLRGSLVPTLVVGVVCVVVAVVVAGTPGLVGAGLALAIVVPVVLRHPAGDALGRQERARPT